MSGRKKGLGRGLSALMNDAGLTPLETDNTTEKTTPLETKSAIVDPVKPASAQTETSTTPASVQTVAIDRVTANSEQPRRQFDRNKLDDLVASIQQSGILQPILVRRLSNQPAYQGADFQIVAGERRWRAALKAGLTSVPIIIRDFSDQDVLEIGVIENVQRADLNPMEEALAYERLINEFGRTQAEIAQTIGKSRVHVANTVRLTGLTQRARDLLIDGIITAGHARALLAASDPDALVEAILKNDWSVRDAERWVKSEKKGEKPAPKRTEKPTDITSLEQRIQDKIGLKADIRHGDRGGEIRLKYKDLDQMTALLAQLGIDR